MQPVLARISIAVVGVAALVFLGLAFLVSSSWAVWCIPFAVVLGILVAIRPQLEWAEAKRNPPDLDEQVVELFDRELPAYYQELDAAQRLRFRQRTALVRMATDFKGQGFENVPGDVAALIASQSARLTFAGELVVLGDFENVVLYRHPFPSPNIPDPWHASELFAEDGVLIFSVEQALPGILQRGRFFNTVLYEWIRAYAIAVLPRADSSAWPDWTEAVSAVTGHPAEWVASWVGLPDHIDREAVIEVLFHDYTPAFAKTYPELAGQLRLRWAKAVGVGE